MAMDSADQVKAALDVADIVAEYLTLKPAGSGSFKACCPFHQEKTPSFYVNRPRQSWHCFGCNEGGDIISFVQRMEGLDFPEALQLLADKAGIQLPQFDAKARTDKKRLHEVNDMAARFFHAQLLQAQQAAFAREYVKKRGLDDLTVDIWRLGFAPDSWDALANALKSKEVTEDELIRAGLCQKSERGGGAYDRFRNRLMFPIADVHGNIVGFTGRILADDKKEAKYVNTPETAVYKKSAVLYGLDKAKGDIKRQDLAVIVEGNMDVIGSHQFDVTNVVCSSGTALTVEQLTLLKRFTENLAIAFDADSAGNAATIRGLDLARGLDFNIKIISLPPEAGKDPDDAVRKDPNLWRQAIADALPVVDWLYRNAFRGNDSSKPDGKKEIAKSLLAEFRHIPDPVERDAWINRLAKDLDVSADSLREAMRGIRTAKPEARNARPDSPNQTNRVSIPAKTRDQELQERSWAVLFVKPELEPLAKDILQEYYLPIPSQDDLLNFLAVLADREFQDQSLETLRRELELAGRALREIHVTGRRSQLEQQMREAERAGDQDRISELLAQFNALKGNP
ncbi:MAG: DNA primase [Patescibacteria group bacterium]